MIGEHPRNPGLVTGDTFKNAAVGRYMFTMKAVATATFVGQAPEGARFDILYSPDQSGSDAASTNFKLWQADWGQRLADENLKASKDDLTELREAITYGVAVKQKVKRKTDIPKWSAAIEKQEDAISKLVAKLTTIQRRPDPLWLGLEATLVSGSDWMLVRNDGVAELSGLMAFKSNDDPDQALINTTISGAVDLDDVNPGNLLARLLQKIQAGGLDIVVAATFEAGRNAPSWAPNGMQRQAAGFWKYERLTRSQFLAIGNVTSPPGGSVGDTNESFEIQVNANVFEVRTRHPGGPRAQGGRHP